MFRKDVYTQIQVGNNHHGICIEKRCNKKYLVNALGPSQPSINKKNIVQGL